MKNLDLGYNQIDKIQNLKGVKKLESLIISYNKITDPSIQGAAFMLLDLIELNLRGNPITSIKNIIYGYPKVEEVDFSDCPIVQILHNAFRECTQLTTLDITNIKMRNYKGDLAFLRNRTNL